MKKIILGSFTLILFSSAILLFQFSCTKSADAEPGANGNNGTTYTLPPATSTTLGGVIVGNGLTISNTGVLSANSSGGGAAQLNKLVFIKLDPAKESEIWSMNYDGSSQAKVNISLPAGLTIGDEVRLSPDGKKLFFIVQNTNVQGNKDDIYSCNVDGSGVTKLYDMPAGNGHTLLGGAY